MKQLPEDQIIAAIERNCSRELAEIAPPEDILRKRVVFLSVRAAKRELEFFPSGKRQSFSDKAAEAKSLSQAIEKLSKRAKSFGTAQILGEESQRLKLHAEHLGKCLRRFGGKNHDEGISVVVMNVLAVNPQFKAWESLAHVIAEAYIAAGRVKDAGHITADKLLREARQCRERMNHEFTNAADSERDSDAEASHAPGPHAKVVHGQRPARAVPASRERTRSA
jgi:hypothetical protein